MTHYDLAVIGTGSGNSILDERFADWDVALVERGTFGGTCLNAGCIPTKMFVHTADLAATPAAASRFGVDETLDGVRWPEIRDRIFGRIDPIAEGGRNYRMTHPDNARVTVHAGTARFTGHKELTVAPHDGGAEETFTADRIVLAAGSRPTLPPIDGLEQVPFHTSDTVMRLAELPRRLTIVGSGFIAAEFAHIFSALGSEVTLLARSGALLRSEDDDVSRTFTELADARWDVRRHTHARRVELDGDLIRLHADGPQGPTTIESDTLLIATGRTPNGDQLDLPATGLTLADSGLVEVDDYQRTAVEGIWALGDVCSPWQLKHVANHEQRVVQHNLLHDDDPIASDHRYVPHAVFSSPQIASVGLTERNAEAQGRRYVTVRQEYGSIAYGWAMADPPGFLKVLADPDTAELLGAHLIGPQAPTLIQPLIQAMSFGLDARQMARGQYWIHPAMPELVENALLALPLR